MPVSLRPNPVATGKNTAPFESAGSEKSLDNHSDPVGVAASTGTADDLLTNASSVRLGPRSSGMRTKPVAVSVLSSPSASTDGVSGSQTPPDGSNLDCEAGDVAPSQSETQQEYAVNGLASTNPSKAPNNPTVQTKTTTSNNSPAKTADSSQSAPHSETMGGSRICASQTHTVITSRPSHHYTATSSADPSSHPTGNHPVTNQRPASDVYQQQHQQLLQQQHHNQQQYVWLPEDLHRLQQASLALSELALGEPVVAVGAHPQAISTAQSLHLPPDSTGLSQVPLVGHHRPPEGNPTVPPQRTDDHKVTTTAPPVYLPTAGPQSFALPTNGSATFQPINGALPYSFHSTAMPYATYQSSDPMLLSQSYCLPPLGCDPNLIGAGGWQPVVNNTSSYWYFPPPPPPPPQQQQQQQPPPPQTGPLAPPALIPEVKAVSEPQPAAFPVGSTIPLHRPGIAVEPEVMPINTGASLPTSGIAPPAPANNYPTQHYSQWAMNRPLQASWNAGRGLALNMVAAAVLANYQTQQQSLGAQNGLPFAQYRPLLHRMPQAAPTATGVVPIPRVMVCCKGFDVAELRSLNIRVNPTNFDESLLHGTRYFIIKSDCEENVHQSIRHGCWCSTRSGNQRLNDAYLSLQRGCTGSTQPPASADMTSSIDAAGETIRLPGCQPAGHILLFFSIRSSGFFAGVAEMMGPVEANVQLDIWRDSRFRGRIPVRWIYVKNVPNQLLKHICVESYENRSVTLLRDTSEVLPASKGDEMLRIIHSFDQPGAGRFTTGSPPNAIPRT